MVLNIRSFDEVNSLNEIYKAVDYEKYFGEMDLTDEQKQERISLAEKLEDNFLFVLALLFTMQQYNAVDWETIRVQFQTGYMNALSGSIAVDEYIRNYVRNFSYDVMESTMAHQNDPYYYTRDRAAFMAENEANTTFNYSDYSAAIKAGKTMKKWVDIRDKRERETHRKVGGTIKKITEPFMVGNSFMQFAKDTSMGANGSEIINCRCSTKYF